METEQPKGWANNPIHDMIREAGLDNLGRESDPEQMKLTHHLQTCLVFAARYTHHRDTGGTLAVVTALTQYWDQLDKHTQEQIIRESHEATTNLEEWEKLRSEKAKPQ